MSKEQTPITAEELKRTIFKKLSQIFRGKTIYIAEIEKDIEQYAQAKVLEALERELKDLSDCYKAHAKENPRKEVCQVLHTLIMEKQEQIAQVKQK